MERFYAGGRRQTYYELFKACRLCGSGGGYKMPIVQPAAPPGAEPELRHKIRDCCSIDVQHDDKMPPLICELCVDKVNDFYEFREMCHATNTRVRSSLGLPPQTLTQDLADDCILGVSGPLIYNSKELELSQSANLKIKPKDKKNAKSNANTKKVILPPSPPPPPIISLREKRNRKTKVKPQALSLLAERLNSGTKRRRGNEPAVNEVTPPIKKLRFAELPPPKKINSPPTKAEKRSIPPPSIIKKPKEPIIKKQTFSHPCLICNMGFNKQLQLKQHSIAQHNPIIFSEKLGCSPCREWFLTARLAEEHHKWHKTSSTFYRCDRCSAEFKVLQSYTKHFASRQCIPEATIPDPVCTICQKSFVTENIMSQHKCIDPASIGGECPKCKNIFPRRAQLKRHQMKCKGVIEVNPNNPLLKTLKPIKITMSKCDGLLQRIKREPVENDSRVIYDVSIISTSRPLNIKTEPIEDGYNESSPFDVDIKHEIKEEYPDYPIEDDGFDDNYNSEDSQSETEVAHPPNIVINPFARKNNTQVESLSFISLRTIFSDKTFKRKQRQKRKTPKVVKIESQNSITHSAFDSIMEKSNDNIHDKNTPDPFSGVNCSVTNVESIHENFNSDINVDSAISDNIAYANDLNRVNKIECDSMDIAQSYDDVALAANNLECTSVIISNTLTDTENVNESNSCENETFPIEEDKSEQLCHIDKVVSENSEMTNISTTEEISRMEEEINCDNLNESVDSAHSNEMDIRIQNVTTDLNIGESKEDDVCNLRMTCSENDSINRMYVDSETITSDEVKNSSVLEDEAVETLDKNGDAESMLINDDLSGVPISDDLTNTSEKNNSYDTMNTDGDNIISTENELSSLEMKVDENEIMSDTIKSSDIDKVLNDTLIEDPPKDTEKISAEDDINFDSVSSNDIHNCDAEKEDIDKISLKEPDIETKLSDKFSNVADNSDLDLYIDSVLQGELGPIAMKQRNEILQDSNKSNTSVLISDKNVESIESASKEKIFLSDQEIKDNCDNIESGDTDSYIDNMLQEELGALENKQNSIITNELNTIPVNANQNTESADNLDTDLLIPQEKDNVINSECENTEVKNDDKLFSETDTDFKHDIEPVEKSDGDILDLVSDSGDDCNIIDLPEKIKAFEEQLLADNIEDAKECQPMDEATVESLLKDDVQTDNNKNDTEDISSDSFNSIGNTLSAKDNTLNTHNDIEGHQSEKNSSLEDISKSLDLDAISDNDFDMDE